MSRASGFRKFLVVLTLLPALLLLFACVIAYYPVKSLPFLDVFGIFVPLLILFNLLFLVFWLLLRKQYVLISFSSLLTGFLCFGNIYQFHLAAEDDHEKGLSILSYNVQGFKYWAGKEVSDQIGLDVLQFVRLQDPDIVCFQEYKPLRSELIAKYPYKYYTPPGFRKTNQAILSRYPIIDSGSLNFPNTGNNAIYADVKIGQDTLRVYNIHLQSYWIYSFRSLIERNAGKDFLKRLQHTADKHREQAGILEKHREESPYPVVFCGDFNQPAYSPSFKRLSRDMQDSFREAGKGWGTTFKRNYIAARIDFILADDKAFKVLDHKNFDIRKSDHLPVMARLKYNSD